MIIGLTGTIGSGKSLVAAMLEEFGAVVIDTDEIARDVVKPDTPGWCAVVAAFGEDILLQDKTIDRKKLAGVVFSDGAARNELNGILHPLIAGETARRMSEAPPGKHVVLVVPLLFETGFDKLVQVKWVVKAGDEDLVERIIARDGCEREEALGRISSQMSQDEKAARADVVIDNGGGVEDTRRQALEAFNNIEKL